MGSNQQPQDYGPNAFQLRLRREICSVGLKLLLYSASVSHTSVSSLGSITNDACL